MSSRRAARLSPAMLLAAWAGALGLCAALRALLFVLGGLPPLGAGTAAFLFLLAVSAWVVLEEPALAPGGGKILARTFVAALLAVAGEALIFRELPGKDALAPWAFGGLLGGAALLYPVGRARTLALAAAGTLAVLGVYIWATRRSVAWDLFHGPLQGQTALLLFWLALAVGILALAWAGRRLPLSLAGPPLSRHQEALWLGLILLLGALLRFWKAGRLPAGWWYDEINLAQAIRTHVLNQGAAPLYVAEQVENPGAWLWLGGALFKFFGVRLEVLRIASAALGLLAVFPLWGLARLWAGPRWALVTAFVYVTMRWTLVPQRIAFMSGFALFWMLAAFWALWSAVLRGALWRYLLAGLLLGFNLHTYTPARLVPPLVLLFLLLQAVLDPAWRLRFSQWMALALGFLLSGGPMLWYIVHHWHEYAFRSAQVSIFTDVKVSGKPLGAELWGSFAKHFLMFHFRGDFNARHNVHFLPHADAISACLLAAVAPLVLGRCRKDARARFLLLWMGSMLLAGVLTLPVEAPQGHRTILAAPALPLGLLLGLPPLLLPLKAAFGGTWPRSARLFGWGLLAALGGLNAHEVLRQWPEAPATFRSFSPRASAVLRRIQRSGPGTVVAVSELHHEYPFNGYEWAAFARFVLEGQNRTWHVLRPGLAVPSSENGVPTRALLLLWGESDVEISAGLARDFPDIPVEVQPQPFPAPGEPERLLLSAELPWERLPPPPTKGPPPLAFRQP